MQTPVPKECHRFCRKTCDPMMKQDSALTVPTELFLALYTVQTSDQQAVCTVFICKEMIFPSFSCGSEEKYFLSLPRSLSPLCMCFRHATSALLLTAASLFFLFVFLDRKKLCLLETGKRIRSFPLQNKLYFITFCTSISSFQEQNDTRGGH